MEILTIFLLIGVGLLVSLPVVGPVLGAIGVILFILFVNKK